MIEVIGVVGFLLMVGTVGSIDLNRITTKQAIIQCAIGFILMCVYAFYNMNSPEDDDVEDE